MTWKNKQFLLTNHWFFDTIPPAYSNDAEKYAGLALSREPLDGEKGRGTAAEYTAELAPEPFGRTQ